KRDGQEAHQVEAERAARRHLLRFLREKERRLAFPAFAYPLMVCLFAWRKWSWSNLRSAPYLSGTEEEWDAYWKPLQAAGDGICGPLRRILMARFAWSDKLANFYGQFHRSGYVTNYGFAAFAVFCATLATLLDHDGRPGYAHAAQFA